MMTTIMEASLLCNTGKGIATTKEMEASLVPNTEKGTALLMNVSGPQRGKGYSTVEEIRI